MENTTLFVRIGTVHMSLNCCTVSFETVNIDLSSFRKLNQQERQQIPSQGDSTTECGVFLLGFMCAFVKCLGLSFDLSMMSFLRHSFAKIVMNGRPQYVPKASNPTVCPEDVQQVTTGSEISESVSGSLAQGQTNNQEVCEPISEKLEVEQSITEVATCAITHKSNDEIIPSSNQLVNPSNSDSTDAVRSGPRCSFSVHDGHMCEDSMDPTDDIDDDPFDLPPPLQPLDPWPLDDYSVTAQKDETGKYQLQRPGLKLTIGRHWSPLLVKCRSDQTQSIFGWLIFN